MNAAAAPANDASSSGGSTGIEEVTVTARKRKESILKVPVVETAISQEALEQYGTDSLSLVTARVPGLLLGARATSNGSELSIRGVGTTANNATIDQSVSLVIDGLSLSQGLAYTAGMFDVGDVEVLKGPQSLFYGKNNTAGVISLRSADPTDEVEVIGRAGYETESADKIGDVIVSGPVNDWLKLRLATEYSDQDGYFTNIANALPGYGSVTPTFTNVAPETNWIIRGTALLTPVSWYDARLKMNYTKDHINGGNGTNVEPTYCPAGTSGVAPKNIPFLGGDDCTLNRTEGFVWMNPAAFPGIPGMPALPNGGVPYLIDTQTFGSFEQNFHLDPNLTVTSVTGYYSTAFQTGYATTSDTVASVGVKNTFDIQQYTEEVRLTSDYTNSPINFMVGGFIEQARQGTTQIIWTNETLNFFPHPTLGWTPQVVEIHSASLFGQVIWKPFPELEIAPGARWTAEERHHTQFNDDPYNGALGESVLLDPRLDSNNVSPEVSVTYTPTDTLTLFGSFKEGFKSGSFNTVQFNTPTTPSSFRDEGVKGGEVGVKSRLLDGNLLINADAYHYTYSNLQVGATTYTSTGALAITTVNAASALVDGFDFDATYAPPAIEGLTLNGAANYNNAHFLSFPNAPCGNNQTISEGCNQVLNPATGHFSAQDLSGRGLVRAPLWMINFGFDYSMPIADDMTMVFGENTTYSSSYYTALVEQPGFTQSDYIKVSANVAIKGANDAWELAIIGNNLTNRFTAAYCQNSNARNGTVLGGQVSGAAVGGPAGDDVDVCYPDPPRSILLRLTLRPLDLMK